MVRAYLANQRPEQLGKVVLLGTPNQGSELADAERLGELAEVLAWAGPTAEALNTGPDSFPASLPDPDFPVGVIAGTRDNQLTNRWLPIPNDGMVSVASARLDDMTDFVALDLAHWELRSNRLAARQVVAFLQEGQFSRQEHPQQAFFDSLLDLCGMSFEGEATFPEDPGDDWRGQKLVAHIEGCDEDQLRIPFAVGNNRSRTWIISKVEGGLELKHDHRHEDGTPDEVTMYGGTTRSSGTARSQAFPADAFTAELIPEAATNEWSLTLNEDGTGLTYYLERHGKPRFKAELQLSDGDGN